MNMNNRSEAGKDRWRIVHVQINGFRGIDGLELSFCDPKGEPNSVVVLGGPNGCGKTTVLEACLMAIGGANKVTGSLMNQAIRRGRGNYEVKIALKTPNGSTTIHRRLDASGLPVEVEFQFEYFTSSRAPMRVGAVSVTAGKKGKRPSETEVNRLWILKQHAVNKKAHESMKSSTSITGVSPDDLVSRLNDAWGDFYPNSHEFFSVEPVSDDPDEGFDLFLNKNRLLIPLDDLSSGQIELLCIFGWLASRDCDVVFIDEPELPYKSFL